MHATHTAGASWNFSSQKEMWLKTNNITLNIFFVVLSSSVTWTAEQMSNVHSTQRICSWYLYQPVGTRSTLFKEKRSRCGCFTNSDASPALKRPNRKWSGMYSTLSCLNVYLAISYFPVFLKCPHLTCHMHHLITIPHFTYILASSFLGQLSSL
jgi:hypothetical protein